MINLIPEPTRRNDIAIEDKILFMYLLAKIPSQSLSAIDSMKWVFLIKAIAYNQKKVLFRSHFRMFPKGPVSLQVYGTRDNLVDSKVASNPIVQGPQKQIDVIKISEQGCLILEWIERYAFDNPWAFDFIDSVYDQYKSVFENWNNRQDLIYNGITVNGKLVRDYDKPTKEHFNMPYYDNWKIFKIPYSCYSDLNNIFNPEIAKKILEQEKNFCLLASMPSLWSE